jgi:hypothetical protein
LLQSHNQTHGFGLKKDTTATTSPSQHCGGAHEALNKNVNYSHIIIKTSFKMKFLWKTPETKKFAKIFCETFKIFLNNYAIQNLFSFKKGSFDP